VAFKRDIDDARNSPAERIIELLLARGAEVTYHDPYVPRFRVGKDVFHREECWLESVDLNEEGLVAADCVVIVTGHSQVNYNLVVRHARLLIDTVNATQGLRDSAPAAIVRIGAPQ
jgi:UDP-N-acetyl-D-glucosamine dehydrogenase